MTTVFEYQYIKKKKIMMGRRIIDYCSERKRNDAVSDDKQIKACRINNHKLL